MLKFDPSNLKEEIIQALFFWSPQLDIPEELDFFSEELSDNPDLSKYDGITIDRNYLITIWLPEWEGDAVLSCQEFIELVNELKTTKLRENTVCRSDKRILTRVDYADEFAARFFYHAIPESEDKDEKLIREQLIVLRSEIDILHRQIDGLEYENPLRHEVLEECAFKAEKERLLSAAIKQSVERFCIQNFTFNDIKICCSLVQGFSIFGVKTAFDNQYTEDFPPVLESDLFVEIRFEKEIHISLEENIFEAYLFELSGSLGINLEISPRPIYDGDWIHDHADDIIQNPRLRPLLLGKGTTELYKLYNKAISSQDPDIQILYFTKVIEYVSQTVIRMQFNEAIRSKLLSSRALQPDADFINELEYIMEEQRNKKRDREAICQTIITCCEFGELIKILPPYLKKEFKRTSFDSSLEDKKKALEMLGNSLYSTRNKIAHAKANYTPTGKECPLEQLSEFSKCLQVVAQQVIRWYSLSSEDIRLT
jgi:hypothetical protein